MYRNLAAIGYSLGWKAPRLALCSVSATGSSGISSPHSMSWIRRTKDKITGSSEVPVYSNPNINYLDETFEEVEPSAPLKSLDDILDNYHKPLFPLFAGDTGTFSGTTRFARRSVMTRSSGRFFSSLTRGKCSKLPPLDFPLSGVTSAPPLPAYVDPGKTKVTTLPNGVRIASETSTNPVAAIGLYVDCGSVNEIPTSYGATHFLGQMAFKSTANRSHWRIGRELLATGGCIAVSASREQIGYTSYALKSHMPEMVEVLIDCVRNPVFLESEVNEQLHKMKAEIGEVLNDPQRLLLEAVHHTGYSGALANPLMAQEEDINTLNGTTLKEFVSENYTAPRMVLAASGVEHEELVSIAEPLLSDLPKVPLSEDPKSVYVGGNYQFHADSQKTHVTLGFEAPGGWHQEKVATTLTVLQMLMSGGVTFSAGVPGKEMCSRLYRAMNKDKTIESCSAFSNIYSNTGIFGFHLVIVIQPDSDRYCVYRAVFLPIGDLISIGSGAVNQKQLNCAKEATKSVGLMKLESRMAASEDIGWQILTYGERKPIEHFIKAVDEVSLSDIATLAKRIVLSPLTMAYYGDDYYAPEYERLCFDILHTVEPYPNRRGHGECSYA